MRSERRVSSRSGSAAFTPLGRRAAAAVEAAARGKPHRLRSPSRPNRSGLPAAEAAEARPAAAGAAAPIRSSGARSGRSSAAVRHCKPSGRDRRVHGRTTAWVGIEQVVGVEDKLQPAVEFEAGRDIDEIIGPQFERPDIRVATAERTRDRVEEQRGIAAGSLDMPAPGSWSPGCVKRLPMCWMLAVAYQSLLSLKRCP